MSLYIDTYIDANRSSSLPPWLLVTALSGELITATREPRLAATGGTAYYCNRREPTAPKEASRQGEP